MTQNRCVYLESACPDPEDLTDIGMSKSRSQVCGDFSDVHYYIDSIATWDACKRTGVCTGADYAQKLIAELFVSLRVASGFAVLFQTFAKSKLVNLPRSYVLEV
jgi:hypothetical protein